MTINDCLGYISLKQEEVKKLRARIESLEAENMALKNQNTVLKYERLLTKAHDAERLKEDAGFGDDQIKVSDEDWLKYRLSNKEGKIKVLEAKIEMLENDRKDSLKDCCECSHKLQARIKDLKDEISKLSEEKQQEGDNLRNRIKDLESEIDQLKSNPTTVSYSELLAIHTADVETINKLNIRAHDIKKKVQQLKNIINDLSEEL